MADDPSYRREEPVPKLPRGKSWRFVWSDLFRIAFFLTILVALVVMREPCSQGVAQFFETFNPQDAGPRRSSAAPDPAAGDVVPLNELTEEQIREMFPYSLDGGGEDSGTETSGIDAAAP